MKKKISNYLVIFVLSTFLLLLKVSAVDTYNSWVNSKEQETKYIKTLENAVLKRDDDYVSENGGLKAGGLQGFCLTNNYLVRSLHLSANDENQAESTVQIYNKNTFEQIGDDIYPIYLVHGNDCTYNPRTNELLYVTSYYGTDNSPIGRLSRYTINSNGTLTDKGVYEFFSGANGKINSSINSITYDNDHDQYIIYSSGWMYITNSNFDLIKKFQTNTQIQIKKGILAQGIGYWNNHIYFTMWENGATGDSASTRNSNAVFVYDLDGNLTKILYLPKSLVLPDNTHLNDMPEIESIAFYNDGTMLFGFTFYFNFYSQHYVETGDYNSSIPTTKKIMFYSSEDIKHSVLNVKDISVSKLPDKTSYTQNYENLDLTGGKITLTYFDNTTDQIDLSDATVTGFNNTTTGTKTITVKYADKETNFNVSVIPKQISKIEIKEKPTKQTYIQNYENLDLTGGILKVTYNDTSTDEISLTNNNITVSGFDNRSVGLKTLLVNYGGVQTSFNVSIVAKQISKIEIKEKPMKQTYIQNYENLDLTGGILKVTYKDTSTDEISLTNEEIEVTGFSNTTTGSKTLLVKYKNKTCTFSIEIVNKSISKIEIKTLPLKTNYIKYLEGLDLTGGVLKVTYNDNSTDEISMNNENIKISSFDNTNIGEKTIKVAYQGKEVEFKVNVIEVSLGNKVVNTPNTNGKYSLILLVYSSILVSAGLFVVIRKIFSIKNANRI